MTDPRTTQMFVRSLAVTGSHLRVVKQERTLTFVLAELMLARAERDRIYDSLNGVPTREQDMRLTELEDAICLREDEAKAIIQRQTGVPFDAIQSANL